MKKKGKYLLITVIILILIIARGCISFFSAGYTDEVYTAFSTGPGFEADGNIFFPVSYRLFRKPEGLRRFPDGGQSKRIFEAVYLVKVSRDSVKTVSRLQDFSLSDSEIKYTRAVREKKNLKLLFSEIGTENYYVVDCFERKPEADKTSLEKLENSGFADPSLTLTETKKIFQDYLRTAEPEIPSPLKYTDKKKKQLVKDVVRLAGDFYYRAAVIDTLSEDEISELPEKMAKYENSLKKGKLEYSIYSDDTKKYIEKRLGL